MTVPWSGTIKHYFCQQNRKDMKEYMKEDLPGALVNFGGDPFLVETEEQAESVAESLNRATIVREITDDDEFATAMRQLDLVAENHPMKIYSFVDGSEGLICMPEDWH